MACRPVRTGFWTLAVLSATLLLTVPGIERRLGHWAGGSALAESGSGKSGDSGGDGHGGSGGSGSSDGGGSSGGSGDNSGKGSGEDGSGESTSESDNSGSGRGIGRDADDEGSRTGTGRRGSLVNRYFKALNSFGKVVARTATASRIEVRYSDGWREVIAGKRYSLIDPGNRRVVDRSARASDYDRLLSAGP
jgi:hypothetical protein